MIYLHTANASRLIVEDIHVVFALSRLPLLNRHRLANDSGLDEKSWRSLFRMTAWASELIRVHEPLELLVAPGELELAATFLASALENSI